MKIELRTFEQVRGKYQKLSTIFKISSHLQHKTKIHIYLMLIISVNPVLSFTSCISAAIEYWFVPLVRSHKVNGSSPTVRFESNVSALSELSINCTMAWVAGRQFRAMLYATLAVS